MIAAVWGVSTVLLVIIQSAEIFSVWGVSLLLTERILFVFSITIPFDIRDMESDRLAGLKTIPLAFGIKRSMQLADLALLLFMLISVLHYIQSPQAYLLPALLLSAGITYFAFHYRKLHELKYYHYAILDGTMLVLGVLVIVSRLVLGLF